MASLGGVNKDSASLSQFEQQVNGEMIFKYIHYYSHYLEALFHAVFMLTKTFCMVNMGVHKSRQDLFLR